MSRATAKEVANIVVWTLLFGLGAMTLFRRDTARVSGCDLSPQ